MLCDYCAQVQMVKLLKIELETNFFFKCSEFHADSKNHTLKAVGCIFIGEMEIGRVPSFAYPSPQAGLTGA